MSKTLIQLMGKVGTKNFVGQTYKFARDTVASGAFIYLNTSKFGCDNSFVNTGEIKRVQSIL